MRLAALLEAEAVITGLDDVAAVGEAIEKGRGHLGVTKDAAPLPEGEIGGHDQGDMLVELTDQVEEERSAALRDFPLWTHPNRRELPASAKIAGSRSGSIVRGNS